MDVNDLKRRRTNLQFRIKEWYKRGKNAKNLVIEYHALLTELRNLGFKVEAKADYLQPEFWDNFNGQKYQKKQKSSTIQNPLPTQPKIEVQSNESIKPNQDSFILCLAWTAKKDTDTPEQIQKVLDYFSELNLSFIDEDIDEIETRIEHVMRYEFKGTEESFKMLKVCTQFVLDAFAKTNFEKFNMAIFGKKKKF